MFSGTMTHDECCWCRRDITEVEEMLTGGESTHWEYHLSQRQTRDETEAAVEGNGETWYLPEGQSV